MAAFCSKCGATTAARDEFCSECGKPTASVNLQAAQSVSDFHGNLAAVNAPARGAALKGALQGGVGGLVLAASGVLYWHMLAGDWQSGDLNTLRISEIDGAWSGVIVGAVIGSMVAYERTRRIGAQGSRTRLWQFLSISTTVVLACLLLISGAASDSLYNHYRQNEALLTACTRGDLGYVQNLVLQNADVNYSTQDSGGATLSPLLNAVRTRNIPIALYLIDHGANVTSFPDEDALYYAAENNEISVAQSLLKNGAYVDDIPLNTQQTPLDAALAGHYMQMRSLLIMHNGHTYQQYGASIGK